MLPRLVSNELWGIKETPRGLTYIPERAGLTVKLLAKESGVSTNRIYHHAADFAKMIHLQQMSIKQLEELADLCFKIRIQKLKKGERK